MGVLCFARGVLASASGLGVYARKKPGGLCVTLLSSVLAPAGIRVRRYSQDTGNPKHSQGQFVCYYLPHRSLLKIQGQDTSAFLQGIITNDMAVLDEPEHRALYAHMLNVQGRTLYDIILYR